jgi:hypothetical protein
MLLTQLQPGHDSTSSYVDGSTVIDLHERHDLTFSRRSLLLCVEVTKEKVGVSG